VSFFQDADGSFAANVRLYDKDVLGQRGAGAGAGPAGAAGAKKVRRARGCGGASSASARPLRVSPSAGLTRLVTPRPFSTLPLLLAGPEARGRRRAGAWRRGGRAVRLQCLRALLLAHRAPRGDAPEGPHQG
jgi:hypothetical protein